MQENALLVNREETYLRNETDALLPLEMCIRDRICTRAEVDVIGAGNVKRMEDIKKLLYAGCKKAVLDYEKESNIEITEEVSLKFGKEKILISYNDPSVLELHKDKIEKYVSAMILMNPHQIRETQSILSLPFFVQINQVALKMCIRDSQKPGKGIHQKGTSGDKRSDGQKAGDKGQ